MTTYRTKRWAWGVVAAIVAAVLAIAATTAAATVGTRTRLAESPACTPRLFTPPRSPAYADTTWPTEHADVWRTHAVKGGPDVRARGRELSATVATLPPAPAWGYTGTRGEIYVVGGAPYLLDMFTKVILGAPTQLIPLLVARSKVYSETVTPYVARINPQTMQVDILNLTGGTTVNYVGGILVHSNGYIYAVARGVLYKIDPTSFTVVKQMVLPPLPKSSGGDNEETAYNGLVATKNGDLILKGWASTGGGESAPGFLLRIDPKDLATKAKLDTTVITSARMTVVRARGNDIHLHAG